MLNQLRRQFYKFLSLNSFNKFNLIECKKIDNFFSYYLEIILIYLGNHNGEKKC